MQWQILESSVASAQHNMELDYALLKGMLSTSAPILHLYEWEGDCATHGYFQDPFSILRKEAALERKLNLARRPTGGGLLFHLTDFTFSILIPASHPAFSVNTLQNYAFINLFLAGVIEKFTNQKTTFYNTQSDCKKTLCCMADPAPFDVMIGNKKVAGGAQRRTKYAFLHQGSVSLTHLPEFFLLDVLQYSDLAQKIKENTYSIVDVLSQFKGLSEIRRKFKTFLINEIQEI